MHSENRDRQDREHAQEDLATKNAEIEKLLSRHKSTVIRHLKTMPQQGKHTATLSKYLASKTHVAKDLGAKLAKEQRILTQVRYFLIVV